MKNTLAIDFGASRIKSVLLNNEASLVFETEGSIKFGNSKFSPIFFYLSAKKHLNFYYKKKISIENIFISSEMHGFFLFNKKKNFSPYLSWRFESKKKKIS